MTARWLVPTIVYVLAVGGLGVTAKLALRSLGWQDLAVWTGIGYVVFSAALLVRGDASLQWGGDTFWAMASAAIAIGGLVALYTALGAGEASKVIPISAAYPLVTLVLSAAVLAERISLARSAGACLVIAGVVILSTTR
jgi:bacterial/archaeal transporter family protein